MSLLSKIVACLLLATLSAVVYAQRAPARGGIPSSQATLNEFLKALSTNRRMGLYSGPPVPCTIGTTCDVKLKPQELFDAKNNLIACAMQVGEVQIDVGNHPPLDKKTVIHWTIDAPAPHTPPTNAIYFFETRGLIVFKDEEGATLKKADSVTDTDVYMTHKFKHHVVEVIYYPLVFQKIGSNPPALCGSADPRIVNN